MNKNVATCKKHVWKKWGTRGVSIVCLRCSVCNEQHERPATKSELSALRKQRVRQDREMNRMHVLGWAFQREFKDAHGRWKHRGWDFMERVKAFAKRNPTVRLASVDDSYHMGSVVALIPHVMLDGSNWGTTMVGIPQNGDTPLELHLYPEDARSLMNGIRGTFKKVRAEVLRHPSADEKREVARSLWGVAKYKNVSAKQMMARIERKAPVYVPSDSIGGIEQMFRIFGKGGSVEIGFSEKPRMCTGWKQGFTLTVDGNEVARSKTLDGLFEKGSRAMARMVKDKVVENEHFLTMAERKKVKKREKAFDINDADRS